MAGTQRFCLDRQTTKNPLKTLAGAGGFEPPHGGIKIRCLTTWLRPIARCADHSDATCAVQHAPIFTPRHTRPVPYINRRVDRTRLRARVQAPRRSNAIKRRCGARRRELMSYRAPVADMAFTLEHAAGLGRAR